MARFGFQSAASVAGKQHRQHTYTECSVKEHFSFFHRDSLGTVPFVSLSTTLRPRQIPMLSQQ